MVTGLQVYFYFGGDTSVYAAALKTIPNIATLHTAYDKSIGAQI